MAVANSPKETYEGFIQFEERAATIYVCLASRFASEDEHLAAFWLDMAMEEKQHAALLQFCVAEKWFAPNLPGEAEIRKFSDVFREFEKRATAGRLTRDEAFALAAELEASEVNAIYCYLTTPLHESLYLLKKKIASSPFDHIGQLVAAGTKFQVSAATLKQLDQLKETSAKTLG
jgi:hypothetical protein